MNRRSFGLLFGAAAAASAFSLPSLAQDEGHGHGRGHDKEDGDEGEGHGNGNGHRKDKDRGDGYGNGNGNGHAYGHEKQEERRERRNNQHYNRYPVRQDQPYFRPQDNPYLTQYYNGPRSLPSRPRYSRNSVLPPTWQNQWQPLPQQAYQQLAPVPQGYQAGYYNGYAVVMNPRTRVIYDVVDVLGALQGR